MMVVHLCKTRKTYCVTKKCNNTAYIEVLLLCFFLHGILIKHFPFLFILLGQRRVIFFCAGVSEEGFLLWKKVLICSSSRYNFKIRISSYQRSNACTKYCIFTVYCLKKLFFSFYSYFRLGLVS